MINTRISWGRPLSSNGWNCKNRSTTNQRLPSDPEGGKEKCQPVSCVPRLMPEEKPSEKNLNIYKVSYTVMAGCTCVRSASSVACSRHSADDFFHQLTFDYLFIYLNHRSSGVRGAEKGGISPGRFGSSKHLRSWTITSRGLKNSRVGKNGSHKFYF